MYLLVFVFTFVALMGLYLETFSLQAARIFDMQKGVAETLLVWHGAASQTIRANMKDFLTNGDCQLSPISTIGVGCSNKINTSSGPNYYLPLGYQATSSQNQWPSYFYKSGDQYILLTFILPPASGSLTAPLEDTGDPNRPATGFSVEQIYRQMQNINMSSVAYGYASGNTFYTPLWVGDAEGVKTRLTYGLPSSIAVPSGSIGYITTF